MSAEPMGLRESLAIIARSLQGLLRVAEGYQVRRAFTTDEQRFVNGATMDIPAERPNGPSHAELVEAREANHKRRNPWDR